MSSDKDNVKKQSGAYKSFGSAVGMMVGLGLGGFVGHGDSNLAYAIGILIGLVAGYLVGSYLEKRNDEHVAQFQSDGEDADAETSATDEGAADQR